MSTETNMTNEPQQRILKMVVLLAGNEFNGLAPSEIARALNIAPPMVTRDLDNLRTAGLADRIEETGRWKLGPKLIQIGLAFTANLNSQREKVEAVATRYSREP
jgi:DNA-binding IclR family transcriptional regulator